MDFTSFDHETIASQDMLKQQSYGHHSTYRPNSSDFDFFDMVEDGMDPGHITNDQLQQAFAVGQKHISHMPQLTPDGTEGTGTGSSVLSGYNPDYIAMSPLHMPNNPENHEEYHTPLQTSTRYTDHDDISNMMDEEVCLL
jgi:hypothetical protein